MLKTSILLLCTLTLVLSGFDLRPAYASPAVKFTVTVKSLFGRAAPSFTAQPVQSLFRGQSYPVHARSADAAWWQLDVSQTTAVWVPAQCGTTQGELKSVPVFEPPAPSSAPALTPPAHPLSSSYISGISDHTRQIFQRGQGLGNRPNVFSKVGDSITAADTFLGPLGRNHYSLGEYASLTPVIAYFSQTTARTGNSFTNASLGAKGGWATFQLLNPYAADATLCRRNEKPLECEYRLTKPSIALIMIGTNDVRTTEPALFEQRLREIIQLSLDRGVIPALSTLPQLHRDWAQGRVAPLNEIITRLAREYEVPLWDYAAALQGLPNDGLSEDGVHPSVTYGHAADFTAEYLQSGMTVRNLLALQTLAAIWQTID